ncbi:hypothetical protein QIS74_01840 [Colletotrichum tabaci]|uniref:Uncharacterized protein n=1 Tax=Colletotrichum tabaci TaxID=1209068 RepID=A0AAV9TQX3_9PEZI
MDKHIRQDVSNWYNDDAITIRGALIVKKFDTDEQWSSLHQKVKVLHAFPEVRFTFVTDSSTQVTEGMITVFSSDINGHDADNAKVPDRVTKE